MKKNGIHFVREPEEADYGTDAVFEELYGNLWGSGTVSRGTSDV